MPKSNALAKLPFTSREIQRHLVTGHASSLQPQRPFRIMPLGGSITHGVGSSDQNGYRKKLLDLLQSSGYNARFVGSRRTGTFSDNAHEGWRGFRIDQIETKAKASAERLLPHVFAVNAGSNDCLQQYNPTETSERLGHLVDSLWAASPGSTVLLSSLLVNWDEATDLRIRGFNQEVIKLVRAKSLGKRKILFVDMHSSDGPLVDDLVEDGTHPNDAGYSKMAKIWLRGIQMASDQGFVSTA